jgi:hypothetical protein
MRYSGTPISALVGLTLEKIVVSKDSDELIFRSKCGREFRMYHAQDCCESVYLAEVVGDLHDLVGARSPILQAEEVSSEGHPAPESAESYTWSFYRIATRKGSVTLRWLGTSNGYYSESVSFVEVQ